MTELSLPEGAYFSVIGNVRLEAGGQTRLALLRHRLFTLHTGQELPLLTFNPNATYDPIRNGLLERRALIRGSMLVNLHEDLRVRRLDHLDSVEVPDMTSARSEVDTEAGYVWRRRHVSGDGSPVWDYLRSDGSLYARTPPTGDAGPAAIFDHDGRPVGQWPTLGGLWRWWTRTLMPGKGNVFLLSDSRFIAEELNMLNDDRVFVLHQMHNPHLTGARRWNSAVSESYRDSMDHLARLDGLISLSARQREDIARRYGATNNLFVIPNPVELPPLPEPPPVRRPFSLAMIARLDNQKRVDRAVDAFGMVIRALPEATLDIYGDGKLRGDLQNQIDAAGLSGAITLHGHVPNAREALWESSAFWLTSQFEGYPLSTLEAMSHGCPVVSFDMKYGPREQIDDGVDGFLVTQGDLDELAARTVELLQDPARLARMRTAAEAKAKAHDQQRFLTDWRSALEQAIANKPERTTVREATWDVKVHDGPALGVKGSLTLDVDEDSLLDGVSLHLQAYSSHDDEVVTIPLDASRDGGVLSFGTTIRNDVLAAIVPGARALRLRVGYVWHNSAGHVDLLPKGRAPREPLAPRMSLRAVAAAALRRAGLLR